MPLCKRWVRYLWLSVLAAEPIRYRLSWETPPRFTYIVEVEATPSAGQHTDFALPAWRPGRYILQNYSGAVSHFSAQDAQGRPLPWRKVNKDTWRVQNPSKGSIRIRYRFYAKQIDAGSSYIGEDIVYFNPINLLMYIPGRLEEPCELELPTLPNAWRVATALPAVGERRYQARSYHHLVDSPFLSGPDLRSEKISCDTATIYAHFWGRVGAQNLRPFMEDLCKIVRTQTAIWGRLPLREYHFIYLLVPFQMRHAVEHEYSAMFVLPEEGAQSEEALKGFLSISAHEFFHVWNVKRLRPAALVPYQYDREVYTSLHWLTEGITDYYTGVTLVRAGLMSAAEYWKRLSAELSQIENAYAYRIFSPAELSIDSWLATSPYRPAAYQGSFYAAGKRVGFLLDMLLRRETNGKVSLDSLLRYLYERYYEQGKGIPEDGVEEAAVQLGGRFFREFFQKFVWGRERPNYQALLRGLPLRVEQRISPYPSIAQIGIMRTRPEGEGLRVEEVFPESIAERAGIQPGDILLTINGQSIRALPEDFWTHLKPGERLTFQGIQGGSQTTSMLILDPERLTQQITIELIPTEPNFIP